MNIELIFEISWDHMAWAVCESKETRPCETGFLHTGKLQLPGQLLDKLQEVYNAEVLLQQDYEKVSVIWFGLRHTFVPTPLFSAEQSTEYLKFTGIIHPGEEVKHQMVPGQNAVLIYSIPSVLISAMEKLWPGCEFNYGVALLSKLIYEKGKANPEKTQAQLCIRTQSFDLLIQKGEGLLYANTFEYRTPEELLYYSQYTFDQLQLDPSQSSMEVCGELEEQSVLHQNLKGHFPDLMLQNEKGKFHAHIISLITTT